MSIDQLNEEQWKEINNMMQSLARFWNKCITQRLAREELENEQAAS